MDHGICEIHGGGYKRSCTKCELEAADKEIKRLRHEADGLVVQRTMAVARLGGEVEGAPTHAGNFLQRIDALRDIEEAAWRMANIWDRATMENDSREIAKAMGLANYLAMFDAWSAVEAALAPRSERREGEPANASDYDHRIHSCPDARVWAKFFMDCKREWGWEVDEEAMRGWFANAMMAMHDHIKASAPPAAPKAPEHEP